LAPALAARLKLARQGPLLNAVAQQHRRRARLPSEAVVVRQEVRQEVRLRRRQEDEAQADVELRVRNSHRHMQPKQRQNLR
jgi:hypothetical protein